MLIFEQLCELSFDQRVLFEPLAPVEKLSVIRACRSSYLGVVGDGSLAVASQFDAVWGHENPMAFLFGPPVPMGQPFSSPGGMFVSGPLHELTVPVVVTPGEDVRGRHRPILVGPSTDHGVEFLDERLL